jgi:hypothetical protein
VVEGLVEQEAFFHLAVTDLIHLLAERVSQLLPLLVAVAVAVKIALKHLLLVRMVVLVVGELH